jgi:4-hydroxythreonine-4-phosphate dehydrogenase
MNPIALPLGDPCGIGPEIAAKAWSARGANDIAPFFAIGDVRAIEAVWPGPVVKITDPADAEKVFPTALPIIAVEGIGAFVPGQPTIDGAQSALQSLELAIGLTRSGAASALVTGPVSKAQLYKIGFTHPGQTEFIAERCGVAEQNAVMLLASAALRVVPVTVHIPISAVPGALTTELILAKCRAAAKGLTRDFGMKSPRIAIAGLNPHAGEAGMIGREEITIIQPAIDMLRAEGIDCFGPVPPDALFTARARTKYDLALCMYHDQALIPLKALYFDEGVNMTLGLPIIRTSPDHGTAFDIAGHGKADPSALIAALNMAASAAHFRATAL